MAFKYMALQPGEFRLLKFLDSTGTRLQIRPYSLQVDVPYVALSYVWGKSEYQKGRDPSDTYSVTLNGTSTLIQQNLFDAMTELGPRLWEAKAFLWVDFLCINQVDLSERSLQVTYMKSIYGGADSIYSWIGLPFRQDEISQAVCLMRKIRSSLVAALASARTEIKSACLADDRHLTDIEIASLKLRDMPHLFPDASKENFDGWMGIATMFLASYWERAWCVQEVLKVEKVTVFCGPYWFYLRDICACNFMADLFSSFATLDPYIKCGMISTSRATEFAGFAIVANPPKMKDLLTVLMQSRKWKATDPRDKVYASLGLVNVKEDMLIVPDYRKPLEQVYIEVAQYSLGRPDHGLRILGCAVMPVIGSTYKILNTVHEPRLPTWVPDWRQSIRIQNFWHSSNATGEISSSNSRKVQGYKAGGTTIRDTIIQDQMLNVKGAHLDEVVLVSTIWCGDNHDTGTPESWATLLRNGLYKTGEPVMEAFLRTIVADIDPESGIRGYKLDWDVLKAHSKTRAAQENSKRQTSFMALNRASYCRRLFITREGYMGLGPAATKVNDKVNLFLGGEVLYITRPFEEGTFEFVGECYVHGLMDGEALVGKLRRDDDVVLFTFV